MIGFWYEYKKQKFAPFFSKYTLRKLQNEYSFKIGHALSDILYLPVGTWLAVVEEYGVEPLLGRVGDEDLERGLIARGVRQDRNLQWLEIEKMAGVNITQNTISGGRARLLWKKREKIELKKGKAKRGKRSS